MSPNRITMTRAEAIRRRHEEEQKRREILVKKTIVTPKLAPTKPKVNQRPVERAAPRLISTKSPGGTRVKPTPVKALKPGPHNRRYDAAFSAPYGRAAANQPAAAFAMPKIAFGPRWISFLLVALCVAALYFITSDSFFMVSGANVIGNNRVSADDITSALGAMGKPAALLDPAQIEYNLLAAFPDIASARVEINLPADVSVTVTERQPVAAWQQDGQTVWVDAQGYAFPPRGLVEGLVTVTAVSAPPAPIPLVGAAQSIGARPFLTAEMAAALMILSPRVPQGSTLVYDPRYGLGWADPRGWQAYFGHTHGDVNAKIQVYQSMVDYLIKRGITPKLISVEYPDAPFYRTEN